jgi:hypothetical protein
MPSLPRTDQQMWAHIQPIIADGWTDRTLVADRVVLSLEIEDAAEAERIRAWADRVLIERTLNMTGG